MPAGDSQIKSTLLKLDSTMEFQVLVVYLVGNRNIDTDDTDSDE